MLCVADLSPDIQPIAPFLAATPWAIAVGVRQGELWDCLQEQCKLALLIESNPRYADRFRDDSLENLKYKFEVIEALIGPDHGVVPWFSYNDCRFDGPLPLEAFQQNYPNLLLRTIGQHPVVRLDVIAQYWLERMVSTREKASGLLLIQSPQPLAILQGAFSLFPWLGSILLLPSEFHSLGQLAAGLDPQMEAVEALLKSHHFASAPSTTEAIRIWHHQPIKALQAELNTAQSSLQQSEQDCDALKAERDNLLRQLEDMQLHNSRLADYRDHLESYQRTLQTQLDESQSAHQLLQQSHEQLESENLELKRRQQELIVLVERASEDLAHLSDRFFAMPDPLGRLA